MPPNLTENQTKLSLASCSDPFDVKEVQIRDALSDLFDVTIVATCDNIDLDLDTVIGKGAALLMATAEQQLQGVPPRVWAGVCVDMTQVEALSHDANTTRTTTYQLVIRPNLWRSTLRKNNRIFEHLTIPEIVQKVLKEWEVEADSKLQGEYKKFEYRVQYGETDYAFMSRLLEEAGITFYFKHEGSSGSGATVTKLVLTDSPEKASARGGKLPYYVTQPAHDMGEFVRKATLTQVLPLGTMTIRDHDFRKRPDFQLITSDKASGREAAYEWYEYLPGAFWTEPGPSDGLSTPVADDKGVARGDSKEGTALAKRALEAARTGRRAVTFETNAIDLLPGTIVALGQGTDNHHPRSDLGPSAKLLITETVLVDRTAQARGIRCSAVFADQPYRPLKKTPHPHVLGVQSAIVVGPAAEEIHTDEFGRVRVQFHWDREGKYDDKSTCWMRITQGWAGGGYGMVAIPRVGHEVLVVFLDGDPDRPTVVGCVYNATTPQGLTGHAEGTAYKLPDDMTMSGWKTDTTLGSGNYNELKFDDAAEKELIHLQAAKDVTTVVKEDVETSINENRAATIGKLDRLDAGKRHAVSVGPTTGWEMLSSKKVTFSTGSASIVIDDANIALNAYGSISIRAGGKMVISGGSQIDIEASMVLVNMSGASSPQLVKIPKVNPPKEVLPSEKGFKPTGSGQVEPPGALEDVSVKS